MRARRFAFRSWLRLGASLWLAAALVRGCLSLEAQVLETLISGQLLEPMGVAIDTANLYYITESANNCIVRMSPEKRTLINFVGYPDSAPGTNDGSGLEARFYSPQGIVFVPAWANSLVVADLGNRRIRLVTLNAEVSTPTLRKFNSADEFRFQAPAGVVVDAAGRVYVTDLQMGNVSRIEKVGVDYVVTVLASGLQRPAGVGVAADGRVFVADTGRNSIRVVNTNGVSSLYAGSGGASGYGLRDALVATNALFDSPGAVLWEDSVGLLVADTGNRLIRRVFRNANLGIDSVETFAPSEGAGLSSPAALARDATGSLLVTDAVRGDLRRLTTTATNLPAIEPPRIGYVVVTNEEGRITTKLIAIASSVTLYNEFPIAVEAGDDVQTFYTKGPSTSPGGVPDPDTGSLVPPRYHTGDAEQPHSVIDPIEPDVTVKAFSTQTDRRPSPVVSARVRFQVANPAIAGSNPASFSASTITTGAELWYTVDGKTDPNPTNSASRRYLAGSRLNIVSGTSDLIFKIRGFKTGYLPSGVIQQQFYYTNVVYLSARVGFDRPFEGSPGSTVILPVQAVLPSGEQLRTLQFRLEVLPDPATSPPPISLTTPIQVLPPGLVDFIPFTYSPWTAPTYVSHYKNGSVAVAFVGTNASFLLLNSGPVLLAGITIPTNAAHGQRYMLTTTNVSGTPDGYQNELPMTSLEAQFLTVVTNLEYLVGDTAVASWYNVGDFGEWRPTNHMCSALGNNDVNNAFYASIGARVPFPKTDVLNAMDTFPLDASGVAGGDGQIRYLDWQIVLERSLALPTGLRAQRWIRYRENGVLRARPVPETECPSGSPILPATEQVAAWPMATAASSDLTVLSGQERLWTRPVRLSVGVVESARPEAAVRVPVSIEVGEGYSWAGGQIWAVISRKIDGADSEVRPSFEPNLDAGIPAPTENYAVHVSTNNIIFVWNLGDLRPEVTGSNRLGWLVFNLPASAQYGECFYVRFANADGAGTRNGQLVQLDFETIPGCVWAYSPALRPRAWISDEWRTNFFGSLAVAASGADQDPDGDGLSNRGEYRLDSHPLVPDWRLDVRLSQQGVVIRWYGEGSKRYAVYGSSDLRTWEQLSSVIGGNDGWQEYGDSPGTRQARYYRVRLMP